MDPFPTPASCACDCLFHFALPPKQKYIEKRAIATRPMMIEIITPIFEPSAMLSHRLLELGKRLPVAVMVETAAPVGVGV